MRSIPFKKTCIFHWDMNHFVILEKANKNKFFILDPEKGSYLLMKYQNISLESQ
ncbi:cysteine peptidase family C39 domain-containing protein [Photorhabdus hindustanensis]|uniref:cysteine peptidase family C39 domain-containing protein n=1 Tax=Photorhabdus hindustanensis TaxID=2918802 RepID=UPI003BB71A80